MKASGLTRKFLSRREKAEHRRGRSSDTSQKQRPSSSELFFSIFKFDNGKRTSRDGDEITPLQELDEAKLEEVRQKAASVGLDAQNLPDEYIVYALRSKYASNDPDKAIELLKIGQASLSGEICKYNSATRMLGAENRGGVTCYLDALLFAMFAKLSAFECMLEAEIRDDEPRKKLAVLLRLWVNMLRSGKLIETDLTEHIQAALAECGWKEAQDPEQQDTSEAFAFITETLQLPLLTLQVDLFHQGKNDDADHKVVYERLLNLAVPPDSEGKGVKLEDCLEDYFNSQVDVHRERLDEKRPNGGPDSFPPPTFVDSPVTPKSTIRVVELDGSQASTPLATIPDAYSHTFHAPETGPGPDSQSSSSAPQLTLRPHRSRTDSIIQRVVINGQEQSSDTDTGSLFQRAKRQASVVKAVTIPAWQFFKLIPWHSPANSNPQSDLEVARHFNQRPVVGICLKRYMMDKDGVTKRQNTYIDIPDSLRLPRFIAGDKHLEEGGLTADYKLVLQSVICHRGDSLHSGHYISFARVDPILLTDNRRCEKDPPPDYEEAQWVKFDDLENERVTAVDDIKESLKQEMPYLLLYQIVPIVDVAASSIGSIEPGPPAYHNGTPTIVTEDNLRLQDYEMVSRKTSSYFDNSSGIPSAPPSVRFSVEMDHPGRRSFADEDGYLGANRRASIAYGDMMASDSAITSADPSPAVSPGEGTTAQRLSRAAARLKPSKSRPQSQTGETRISQTMSRLGFIKPSREPLRDSNYSNHYEDNEFVIVNGVSDGLSNGLSNGTSSDLENEGTPRLSFSKGKEKEPKQKKNKSKTPNDRPKSSHKNVPDRECVVQ
ncbi:cysteine proteinase [Astrocystis sublimbata]|nr:cysteine proteinase [Astrocystis sublimbata]